MSKRYVVRTNCEYAIEIEAENEKEAIQTARASFTDLEDWDQTWAPFEAEEE